MQVTYRRTLELSNQVNQTLGRDIFQSFLNNTATVHLHSQLHRLSLQQQRQRLALIGSTILKQLLQDIVSEDIRHERLSSGQDLIEDQLLVHIGAYLQSLLDEARAVLVLTEGHHVAQQVAQAPLAGLAIGGTELLNQRVADRVNARTAHASAATSSAASVSVASVSAVAAVVSVSSAAAASTAAAVVHVMVHVAASHAQATVVVSKHVLRVHGVAGHQVRQSLVVQAALQSVGAHGRAVAAAGSAAHARLDAVVLSSGGVVHHTAGIVHVSRAALGSAHVHGQLHAAVLGALGVPVLGRRHGLVHALGTVVGDKATLKLVAAERLTIRAGGRIHELLAVLSLTS